MSAGDLRYFEGKPWSAWTDFFELDVTHDMGIYGKYPGAEPFILAICEYCGDKFKLAAIADHIVLRHSDGIMKPSSGNSSSNRHDNKQNSLGIIKKNKARHNKLPKETTEPQSPSFSPTKLAKATKLALVIDDNKRKVSAQAINASGKNITGVPSQTDELVTNGSKQVVCLTKSDSNKLKLEAHQAKKIKEDKVNANCQPTPPKSTINGGFNGILFTSDVFAIKDKKTELLRKCLKEHPVLKKSIREKALKVFEEKRLELKTSFNTPSIQTNVINFGIKKRIRDKKSLLTKDRTYNPDRHCGVVGKENTKPCTRSLTCKSHSMSLRRAVRGRSKNFDALLADHRAGKDHSKQLISDVLTELKSTPDQQEDLHSAKLSVTVVPGNKSEALAVTPRSNVNKVEDMHPRLSLPVSIKNSSLISVIQSCQVKVEMLPSNKNKLNGSKLPYEMHSELLGKLTKPLSPSKTISKENSLRKSKVKKRKLSTRKLITEYYQYHPWYRRMGGLLYAGNNIPSFQGVYGPKIVG